ncbi:MAG: CinA family protein [Nitrospirae bacterium]|nr:MAG: CinA family protein [Nitrospirota bacterium]
MEDDLLRVVKDVSGTLSSRGLTLAVAESCTGGLTCSALTSLPGASRFFHAGVVAYSPEAKERLLGISRKALEEFGTVSSETALAMARGVRKMSGADVALSITGVAGPDTVDDKPAGLVYIAAEKEGSAETLVLHLQGGREEVRRLACLEALNFLSSMLIKWT